MIKKLILCCGVVLFLVGCTGDGGSNNPIPSKQSRLFVFPNAGFYDKAPESGNTDNYISAKLRVGQSGDLDISTENGARINGQIDWVHDVYVVNPDNIFKWDDSGSYPGRAIPLKPGKASIIVTYKGIASVPFEIIVESGTTNAV